VIFVELETVWALMKAHKKEPETEDELRFNKFRNVRQWMTLIRTLPDFHDIHVDFAVKVSKLAAKK